MNEECYPSAIARRIRSKYQTRNEAIVAQLRKVAGADVPTEPQALIKKQVNEVACLMALVHGGDWRVQIEPERGVVLIARRL